MTGAYVTIRGYGTDTRTRCDACDLNERHSRHKPAAASAAAHNTDRHPATTQGDPE